MPFDFIRSAEISPSTYDAEARTVEFVMTTFAPVTRKDAKGPYVEHLDPAGLDTSTLIGAPLLNSHRTGDASDVVGVITAVRWEASKLIGTARLSGAADAQSVVQRIAEGTLRGVSIGYRASRLVEGKDAQGQRTRTAAAWSIFEVSAVAIPADAGATFRSKGATMPKDTQNEDRSALYTRLQSAFNLPDTWATRMTEVGEELSDDEVREDARAAALEARAARKPAQIRTHGAADDPATIVTRQADALSYRMAGGELPPASREFVNLSLMDLARDSLTRSGVSNRGLSADETLQRAAHGTSDFPLVVSNAANKVALDAYRAAESPLKALSRQRTLSNFKASTSIRLGGMGRLEPMTEQGEFTATSRAEHGESMKLATFGRRFDVSRQLIIDDDLNLLGDTVAALGQAAAQTEADLMVDLITGNPALSDGIAVFSGTRDNTASGLNLDVAGLAAARQIMRSRTDLDGKTLISAAPKFLLVSPALETAAEQLLASIYAATVAETNPFATKLTLLVEPRLGDSEDWFLFADPASLPCLQHAYLSGASGVQIQRQEAWNSLGLSFRAFLDFGASWSDWRGVQRITG